MSKKNLRYIKLPIYSIACFGDYIYFSGGGGGSTGIPNEIHIYHKTIQPEPVTKIATDEHIIENITVDEPNSLIACSANENVVLFRAKQGGKCLEELIRFPADFANKNPTINALCFSQNGSIIATGGEDAIVRFFSVSDGKHLREYSTHSYAIKSIDHNMGDLYLSADNHQIAFYSFSRKQIIRTLFADQIKPKKSLFCSAYFTKQHSEELVLVHFIYKQATYVSKWSANKVCTVQIASQQSCQTAINRPKGVIGIGCGNGSSLLFDWRKMKTMGQDQGHSFVITGCTIAPKTQLFITGTPECSYHMQNPRSTFPSPGAFLLALLITFLLIYLLSQSLSDIADQL